MRIKLDTGDIEAFAAVGQSLSFRAAADALGLSPSALSRRIQKLEDLLGLSLLERTTRSVRLTLLGTRFLARSQDILREVDELVVATRGQTSASTSLLTIAAIPSIAHRLLPAVLRAFHLRHPTTRVRVRDVTTNEVVAAVTRGEVGFGITSFLPSDANLVFTPIVRGSFVLAVPFGHTLARRRRVRWSELAAHRTISTWRGAGVRLSLDYDLAKAGHALDPFYEVQQIYTALHLVEAGLGVAPVPDYFIDPQSGRTAVVALIDPTVAVDLGTVVARAHPLHGRARDFHDLVCETATASLGGRRP